MTVSLTRMLPMSSELVEAANRTVELMCSTKSYETPNRPAKAKALSEIQGDTREHGGELAKARPLGEIADKIMHGHAVRGAILCRSDEEPPEKARQKWTERAFLRQTAILLDFDDPIEELQGKPDDVRQFIDDKLGQPAVTIAHESSTSSEKQRKWHVILMLKEPIEDFETADRLHKYIVCDVFGKAADQNAKDCGRVLLGSTPDKMCEVFGGQLDAALLNIPEPAPPKPAPKYKAPRTTDGDGEMSAGRLAEIILNSPCNFGAGGYDEYLSCTTALYHIAHIPSETIAAWGQSYDGTRQNPRQWEDMNRSGTFTIGTLKHFAEQLDPMAFENYKAELNLQRQQALLKYRPRKKAMKSMNNTSTYLQIDEHAAAPSTKKRNLTDDQTETTRPVDELPAPPDLDTLTRDDFINGQEIFDFMYTFADSESGVIDEVGLTDYLAKLKARAAALKVTGIYNSRMKPKKSELEKQAKAVRRTLQTIAAQSKRAAYPDWVIDPEKGTVNEPLFCDELLTAGEIRCINGIFYDVDGMIPRDKLESGIYNKIYAFVPRDTAARAKKIADTLALRTYSAPITPDRNHIHVKNGTIIVDDSGEITFDPEKIFCMQRLNVDYKEEYTRPNKWREFLDALLDQEDQQTLQEYCGYCLIPTTKAQKGLFIIGKGGEGKSVVGSVLHEIFGKAQVAGSVYDLDNGNKARFARVKLEGRLLMLDDDMNLEGLENTAFVKQLITAETPSEIEPKGKDPHEVLLYTKVLAFGNGAISSLYDNSDGFWRRQLILSTKSKDPNRVDDPFIIEKLRKEKDDIFSWALRGLRRLIRNGYKFTESEKTKQNVEEARKESNNIIAFLESGAVTIDGQRNRYITTKELHDLYIDWCDRNAEKPRTVRSFAGYLKENSEKYGILFSYHVPHAKTGNRARGFFGISDARATPHAEILPM